MMKHVELEINDRKVKAREGATILEAAIDNDIHIPTLCYDSEVEPYGACRFCMVEISKGDRKRLVASCVYRVEPGLVVRTETAKVRKIRRMIVELLWPALSDERLLKKYGAEPFRFETGNKECSLCGLCVRYCTEAREMDAVYFKGRGIDREVAVLPGHENDCFYCEKCFGLCKGGWMMHRDFV